MAKIIVDGKEYEVDGADNLLHACLSKGIDVPYFCWHPALGSVGACRQCAVKQYSHPADKTGRLVMSCMTPATNGITISVNDAEAVAFRQSVIEWLMINHPHDCPVCEEGGHCHLQDMTVMTQHAKRRYRFTKRTHQNQDLGPFINHEMNRCIACYRCVRYYQDYANGTDLGVFGAHDNVYFGRLTEGVLENEFSGNLVEVCPTGVFTDKPHSAHYTRKWDMQFSPSICQQCSVGCNISPGERYGELRRVENRYNGSVNHYFLCDRGRFGYGYVNRKDRPKQPWLKKDHNGTALSGAAALEHAKNLLQHAKGILGIGSPRASLEANFTLSELVGKENFYCGINAQEFELIRLTQEVLQQGKARTPSLREIETHDAILILGEDVTQTAPRIALAVRQAVKGKANKLAAAKKVLPWQADAIADIGQHEKNPVFIVSFNTTRLDDIAQATYHGAQEEIAQLGFSIANLIESNAPAATLNAQTQSTAQRIAETLLAAEKPLIISGTSCGHEAIIQAAANIVTALQIKGKTAGISLVVPEANSLGVAMLGGQSLDVALTHLRDRDADTVVILENDLYRRAPAEQIDNILAITKNILVLDHQRTRTTEKAHLLLPAASFAEGDGTLINNEGRAQRYFQVYDPTYYEPTSVIKESWRWLHGIQMTLQSKSEIWGHLDEVTHACADAIPALAAIRHAAPEASSRVKGLKIARQPRRYSGRTAMRANVSVHEPRASQDGDSALAFSMEGYVGPSEPSPLIPFAWAPGWNSPQAWNKFQDEVGGHLLAGDPGVRLMEPNPQAATKYYPASSVTFQATSDSLRILPLHHIFGSEELSALSESVKSQIPKAYATLARQDAERLGIENGTLVELSVNHLLLNVRANLSDALPVGTIGLPVGIIEAVAFVPGVTAKVSRLGGKV